MRRSLFASLVAASLAGTAGTATADFIDTTWSLIGFSGEAWQVNPGDFEFASQTFSGGMANGPFFECSGGMSATYTTYENDAFFENPEFELFEMKREGMEMSSEKLFVHRLSCSGHDGSLRVMYPFVTNEARASAWYLYEGGIFTFYSP